MAPTQKKAMEHFAEACGKIFKFLDQFPVNVFTDRGEAFFNSAKSKIFLNYGINNSFLLFKTKSFGFSFQTEFNNFS